MLLVGIAQGSAILSLQKTIDSPVHRDVVRGVFEGGDAVAHLHPRLAAQVLLIDARTHANPRLGRVVEHRAPDAFYRRRRQRLPVVRAAGGPLHQVHLLQVLAVGKRLVADEEIEVAVGGVAHSRAILEIDALDARHAPEGVVGDAAQVGMTLEEAHQVVEDIHLAARREIVGIDGGCNNIGLLSVYIIAVLVSVPAIVAGLVDVEVEETRVVVLRDVRVLHTLVGVGLVITWCPFRHSAGFDHCTVVQRHLIGNAVVLRNVLCPSTHDCNRQP